MNGGMYQMDHLDTKLADHPMDASINTNTLSRIKRPGVSPTDRTGGARLAAARCAAFSPQSPRAYR